MKRNTVALGILGTTIIAGAIGVIVSLSAIPTEEGVPQYLQSEDSTKQSKESKDDGKVLGEAAQTVDRQWAVYVVVSNDGQSDTASIEIQENDTAYTVMKRLEEQGDLKMQAKETALGPFMEAINGVTNNNKDNLYWFLYINGESSTVGADAATVFAGDTIEWRYEQAQ